MSDRKSGSKTISLKNLVGVLTVVLVAAYFIFMFVSFRNQKKISFYEVEEGSIVKERSYEGIILREETVKTAEASGYVNFYVSDAKKAAKYSRIYSIDENGDLKNFLLSHSAELNPLSGEKLRSLHTSMMDESRSFDRNDFNTAYIFRERLESEVSALSRNDILNSLSDEIRSAGLRFIDCHTDSAGLVSYSIDGYETKLRQDLKEEDFDRSGYSCTRLKSNDLVTAGTPVYKLITSEKWEIIFPLTEEDVAELTGKNSVKVSFRNHGLEASADFEMYKTVEGKTFGALKLSKYLVRFINDRFVTFEIETNHVSGLKIPEKSVTTKDFYRVPLTLKKKDERGNAGVFKLGIGNGSNTYSFIVVESCKEDENSCYINLPENGDLKPGDYIGDPDDPSVSYRIEDVSSLKGTYNINKGYAVFKLIEELERANGYCIIKKNTPYGLAVYDHIILDASTVEEGQVLY